MNNERFDELSKGIFERCSSLLKSKGGEYDPGFDRLSTWKSGSEYMAGGAMAVLFGQAWKHIDCICRMCKKVQEGESFDGAMWDEKIGDAINYLVFVKAMAEDLSPRMATAPTPKEDPEEDPAASAYVPKPIDGEGIVGSSVFGWTIVDKISDKMFVIASPDRKTTRRISAKSIRAAMSGDASLKKRLNDKPNPKVWSWSEYDHKYDSVQASRDLLETDERAPVETPTEDVPVANPARQTCPKVYRDDGKEFDSLMDACAEIGADYAMADRALSCEGSKWAYGGYVYSRQPLFRHTPACAEIGEILGKKLGSWIVGKNVGDYRIDGMVCSSPFVFDASKLGEEPRTHRLDETRLLNLAKLAVERYGKPIVAKRKGWKRRKK